MKYLTIFLFAFIAHFLNAQVENQGLEQLKRKAEAYYYSHLDSTRIYADSLINQATEQGEVVYLGEGKRLMGVYHQLRVESEIAKALFEEAAKLFSEGQDTTRFGRALLSVALMDINLGNYDQALDLLMQSETISESVGHEQYRLRAMAEIGRVYSIQGNHEKALKQFRLYYGKVKDVQDLRQLGTALNYISVEFMHFKQHDSSLYYLEKNLQVQKRLNYAIGVAAALQNMASVYLEQGNEPKALRTFLESAEYYEQANFYQGIGQVNMNIAAIYSGTKRFSRAAQHLEKAIRNSSIVNDFHALRAQYMMLSDVYDSLNQKSKALENFRAFHAVNDTLLNIDKQRTMADLFTKYETREKEQQIEVQDAQINEQSARLQRNQTLILALIVIALLLLLVLFLVRNRKEKEKALIKKEATLKLREAEINAVIHSQEKERNRFARDLHDGFGQMISVLKLNMGQLKEVGPRELEKREEIFSSGEQVINEMYAELRNICFDLMPQTLVKHGLEAALSELAERVRKNTSLACDLMVFDLSERLPELLEIALFRIAQEWVNNVLKYANANELVIQITKEENELTMTIEDDGTGFDPMVFYNGKGNGWTNIQTRLNQSQGSFELDSREGVNGSMVTVNIVLGERVYIPTSTEAQISD